MHGEVSKTGGGDGDAQALRKRLDSAVVLQATVAQLRKDLHAAELVEPSVGDGAFEALRAQVLGVLEERQEQGAHAFGLVINRVDLSERQVHRAMEGGLYGLAATVVLRCLQKVLSRFYHAGLG